jgi:hypothetical protein
VTTIGGNAFSGYRAAVSAAKAKVVVTDNSIKDFQGAAIVVKESQSPPHVYGNTATSSDPEAKVVDVQGPAGVVAENTLSKE